MAIVSDIKLIKFNTDQDSSLLREVIIEYSDDTSGSFAQATISFTGTPLIDAGFEICEFSQDPFFFTTTDTISDIHQRLSDFINLNSARFNATFDASSVTVTAKEKGSFYNSLDLSGTLFIPYDENDQNPPTSTGLVLNIVQPSGGSDEITRECVMIDGSGSYQSKNLNSLYQSKFDADRSSFVGKMRSELTLPTPTEVFTDYDANGNVTQVQLLF